MTVVSLAHNAFYMIPRDLPHAVTCMSGSNMTQLAASGRTRSLLLTLGYVTN